MTTSHWLMKSEPITYSIDHLQKEKTTFWNGVRNYQARNFMRDQMSVGDKVLFYHSNTELPGVTGIARIVKAGYQDHTQFDPKSPYYDPKATKEKPLWFMVDIAFVKKFKSFIALERLRMRAELKNMVLLQKGSRLSVQPVDAREFAVIEKMGG